MDLKKIDFITNKFFYNSKVLRIDSIDSGLINKTYIIEFLVKNQKSKYILQCLSNIFESQEIINMNHKLITDHIKEKIKFSDPNLCHQRWEVPALIRCKSNNNFLLPFDSNFWRAMVYIDDTFSLDILQDKKMAYQTGIGLAKFHETCSDLDFSKLVNSIKNFHDTKYYINHYDINLKNYKFLEHDETTYKRVEKLTDSLSNHILYVESILYSLKEKSIDFSVIHGDPKLSNFLFDINYKYVVSLVDLDTVSYGYLLTDLADCIRSICNLSGEDPENLENVFFDVNSFDYFLRGYFSILNEKGNYYFTFLPEFIYLIIVELTIRFLSDFFQSNKYFKIKYPNHNLYRAEVQHRLLSSFVTQIPLVSNLLHEFGIFSNPTFISDVQKIV